ncbi:MAG: Uma2 family endonuclease [Polyangiaceae bacterium]|nr:Uma2 family endonuclease [Polyangiaceae bacterium]
MEAVTSALSQLDPSRREGGVVLENVSWDTYEGLLRALGDDHPSLRLTYLEGRLEIMTTSYRHERIKKLIARLLEIWALERNMRFDGYGGATFKKKEAARGLEPDECYVLREVGDLPTEPDIAIEVVETHGTVDKMAVYAGLGVREVWVWEANQLKIHMLQGGRYVISEASALLPTLDVVELAEFVRQGEQDQTATVRRYWELIRERG